MLLTITTTHRPATDLGYLLGKRPDRVQSFELPSGRAHVFYPEASDARCTAALLLDLDPLDLVRAARRSKTRDELLTHYVNDRPYASSSFTSAAISRVFGAALGGRSRERPELAATAIPLEATLATLPVRGGERFLRELFEPLGYEVEAAREPLDPRFEAWGGSRYYRVTLRATTTLGRLLTHLFVLVPVLDDDKHYWVGDDEVEKLLAKGADWLPDHPRREEITRRYLKRQGALTRRALERLIATESAPIEDEPELDEAEDALETKVSLNERRLAAVLATLRDVGAARVLDLGCGEGRLLRELLRDRRFERVVGLDVSTRALGRAHERLRLETLPPAQRARIELLHGSLTYRDARLAGFDAACAVEVIEHLDPWRLDAFARVVFEHAAPRTVILTTPNAEFNVRFDGLAAGAHRHADHRFEWSREEFGAWAHATAARFGYTVRLIPVGDIDEEVGPPTQMGVFSR
ncbi:MAG: 3' terminal RNA ribose 2'-O-methyltransferase Hen1 [Sandaracinaceae bacterium]|nr:3' terminal RNA ribose 2'-O-methyltransferase Hen1 [Sandaracinaceae bacterium]